MFQTFVYLGLNCRYTYLLQNNEMFPDIYKSTVNNISTRQNYHLKNSPKHNWLFVHTQNCDKKQYLFPQLGGGITQPHVIQSI